MEAELREGCRAWIKLPYGDFVVNTRTDVTLFAGGTGVTAFTAFLEGADAAESQSIRLAYGARNRSLLIYRDLIQRCARKLPLLDVAYFVEEADRGGTTAGTGAVLQANEREEQGRVSVAAVWPSIRAPQESDYYISGPPAMLTGVAHDLRDRGIAPEAIHIDAWE
jgi:ferredoxin-NADP reductase